MKDGDYQLTVPYACGWVYIKDGVIIDSAPIYKNMRRKKVKDIKRRFSNIKFTRLKEVRSYD